MLSERRQRVLRALIEDYIEYALPVGSRTLTERHRLGVSPATVRNDLSALEDAGFIQQPHTSAGRVPTDAGYRTFVDELLSSGLAEEERPHDSEQFDVSDQRTLDEVVRWLMEMDFIPSFCTACYREGRTGDRFMSLCKSGQILNCCHPNALMTLTEYLVDYASPETRAVGFPLIERELRNIPKEKVRQIATEYVADIQNSNRRDFRF